MFADQLIGRQTLQSLQPAPDVVGVNEVAQVLAQLREIVVMQAFDSRFFDEPVHPLDLPVGPRMFDLGQAVFDAMLLTNPTEDVLEPVPIAAAIGELRGTQYQRGSLMTRYALEPVHNLHAVAQGSKKRQCKAPVAVHTSV